MAVVGRYRLTETMATNTRSRHSTKPKYLRPILLVAVGLLLAGAALANTNCQYCGKVIDDEYVEYNNQLYHPACYHQHVAPRCALCGKEIDGGGITYEGKNYHSSCYKDQVAPRCALCGKEIEDGGIIFEGKHYHKQCYEDNVALRCSVCGGIIEGEYLIDHWGNKYHKVHEKEIASCSFCGRLFTDPLAGGGIVLDATHKICNACNQTAISNLETAQPLIDQSLDLLAKVGITVKPKSFKFKLVTREELGSLTGQDNPDQFGLTHYKKTEYLGFLEDKKLVVYIIDGLPRCHFISAAAHELMHVWLFLNSRYDPDVADPQMIEGSLQRCSATGASATRR